MINDVDLRKKNVVLNVLDTSSSMNSVSSVDGIEMKNIDIACDAVMNAIEQYRQYNRDNVVNKIDTDVISFNTEVSSLFEESVDPEMVGRISMQAGGVTNLKALLDYLLVRISKEAGNCAKQHPVSVMLITDGQPTDATGHILSNNNFNELVSIFRSQLSEMNIDGLVDIYAIMVGAEKDSDWFNNMKILCDEEHSKSGRVFIAEDMNHAVMLLDFVTRYGVCGDDELHIEQGEKGGMFVETMEDYNAEEEFNLVGMDD